jgi:hypothetical protein
LASSITYWALPEGNAAFRKNTACTEVVRRVGPDHRPKAYFINNDQGVLSVRAHSGFAVRRQRRNGFGSEREAIG